MAIAPPPTEYTYERPWMAPYQVAAIFNDARYAIIEASTKSGKTVGCMAWLIEQALEGGAGHYWWVAPVYGQAKIAYDRIRSGLPRHLYHPNDSDLTLALFTGAVLEFKSAEKPDNLYGQDVRAAVLDEASRAREEAWHALRSTLTATRGPVRIIGNVKGRKNWAYQLARKAEAGEPGMAYAKITAADAVAAGVLDADEVADAKRQLPASVYQELYEAEPVAPELSRAPSTAFGVDLAKSQDWTVVVGLDAAGQVCHLDRYQSPWEETFRRILAAVGPAPALVDSTGVGDPIVERLQREGGPHYEGYQFTAPSKQKLMEGLAVAIQQGEVRYPDGPLVNELEAFEYVYTRSGVHYSAPEGLHDDCVCALALAVWRKAHGPRLPQVF
jgi:hypothetical protein